MPDNEPDLPEGTDTVIAGASATDTPATGDVATTPSDLTETFGTSLAESDTASTGGNSDRPAIGGGNSESGLADRLRSGRERLTSQAGDRARGLVGQSLERGAEALANVGRMVGDTAGGIDDRLGNEYGDYARRAAGAIENAANSIASKDPDELIDDARTFVRNSPGIALAGAAVVGFVVARLVKSGLASTRGNGDDGED
jgi:ElaB/YqjD/DUF883 family membrane-anchored ribosome-binding protein